MSFEKMVAGAYDITRTSSEFQVPYGKIVPVLDMNFKRVNEYPVKLYNDNDVELGVVENLNDLIILWNSDPANQVKGKLELAEESTSFYLINPQSVSQRGFVRGDAVAIQNSLDILDNDGQSIVDSDNSDITYQ